MAGLFACIFVLKGRFYKSSHDIRWWPPDQRFNKLPSLSSRYMKISTSLNAVQPTAATLHRVVSCLIYDLTASKNIR